MRDKQVNILLEMASKDIRALNAMRKDFESFDDEIFGFHAQQSAEKLIKALLSFHTIQYPKTHDIKLLFDLAANYNLSIPHEFHELMHLTDFSVDYRYDFFSQDEEKLDRESIFSLVTKFQIFVTDTVEKT